MTLLDAFRLAGPLTKDRAGTRRQAAEVLYIELQRIGSRVKLPRGLDRVECEDLAAEVLIRFLENGPRCTRPKDPTSDAGVRRFLYKSIHNGLIDLWRRRSRQIDTLDDLEHTLAGLCDPAGEVAEGEARQIAATVRKELLDHIIPELARSSRAGAALIEAVEQLVAIHAGRLDVEPLVTRECENDPDPAARRRARNRLDQRFSRARERIFKEICRRRSAGILTPDRADLLIAALDELKLRD